MDVTAADEDIETDIALDSGPPKGREASKRTCIVSRTVQSPAEMIRFVLGPDDRVVPDLKAKLPGRGAWVSATREAVETAVKRRQFRRAFRSERADPEPGLADAIGEVLRADLRQSLALANKAGCVVTGFNKVEAEIGGRAGVAAVIHAREASPDGRRKLGQALRRRLGTAMSSIPIVDDMSESDLDMALGRDHVIHAALVAGAGTTGCLARWRRLRAYEGASTVVAETDPAHAGSSASDLHDDET